MAQARGEAVNLLSSVNSQLKTIVVEGPSGEALIAERLVRLEGVFYEARLASGPRFYRLAESATGGHRVEDVTEEMAPAIALRRHDLHRDAARVAAERAARLKKLAQDHYERTRHSFVVDGNELGFVKPTRETKAKLSADPLSRMLAKGSLTQEQVRAALEIREIYQALSAGLFARAHMAERTGRTRYEIGERIAHLHAGRYLPWAEYLAGRAANPPANTHAARLPATEPRFGTCPVAVEIAIDIVIDGKSLAEIEQERRWRHGMAGEILRYALAVYTQRAGWERNGELISAFEAKWQRKKTRPPEADQIFRTRAD